MTQYNTLNVKLSTSQLGQLKSEIKNGTKVTLNLSSNLIGNSKDETNFPHPIKVEKYRNIEKLKTLKYYVFLKKH